MRFFIEISYKGTLYHGWQVQPNANTIQAEINAALSTLLESNIEVVGAGRTDAGVHAKQMFAHFDYNANFKTDILIRKINRFLPSDIAVHKIFEVPIDVSARFNALSRTYQYHLVLNKNPFIENAYFLYKNPNINNMNLACKYILGNQDFTSFSKVKTQTFTNNCNVMLAEWISIGDELIFTIQADRFLRNMVRAIVGTLLAVGYGKISIDKFKEIIAVKDRCAAGFSVPAHGLFLTKVEYPEDLN